MLKQASYSANSPQIYLQASPFLQITPIEKFCGLPQRTNCMLLQAWATEPAICRKKLYVATNLKGEIMTRFLLMAIAVPALTIFVSCETATAQHFHRHAGHRGRITYAAPVYSYAPVYRTAYVQPVYVQPVYVQPAYVQPAYGYNSGISINIGPSYGGSYYSGRPAYIGRQIGGFGHHHHRHHHHY